ncbi:MAG: CysS/YqeB C-terminal domain-containing protein [Acidimicrobiales bacterium]
MAVADTLPRLLVVMGSGETSPTMSKVHRELFSRLGPPPVPAVAIDTPFGFQSNADDVATKAVDYFRESVGRDIGVASFRSGEEIGTVAHETAMARVREARWVFSGPGSPSYALRQWRGSQLPALLADKLERGGCVVFASAAAVTLGPFALPVYEIYKAGETPAWLDGLDLMAAAGIRAAVIPHYDNAEGGRHDTRYCYMGERRLVVLEDRLPADVFVLGVDEHTALILDLDAGTATVTGLGAVTVRRRGASTRFESGRTMSIGCLTGESAPADGVVTPAPPEPVPVARSPLRDELAQLDAGFSAALAARDAPGAVGCVLQLEQLLVDWSRDTLQSDDLDRGRATLRSMILRLGEAADTGLRDPRDVVRPFVETVLDARARAREDRRWADADALRDRLLDAGIEVRDTPEGSEWDMG